MAGYCESQGCSLSGPCIERYLDMNPQAVKPEERRTEIVCPVVKQK